MLATQDNWRWCNKCQGLFFAGNNTLGKCPSSDGHSNQGSGNYGLSKDTGSGQDNWRWCNKCQGLFFAGNNTLGKCSLGGGHSNQGSGNYILTQGSGSGKGIGDGAIGVKGCSLQAISQQGLLTTWRWSIIIKVVATIF